MKFSKNNNYSKYIKSLYQSSGTLDRMFANLTIE